MQSSEAGASAPAGRLRWGAAVALAALALALLGAEGPARPNRFDTVVLDAGHGGEDAGAKGTNGLREKDLVLDVTRRLAEALRGSGLEVVLTRSRDRFVPLEERTAVANDAGGDLFVSLHANAAESRRPRGIETFFAALEASDASARRLAKRENQAFEESPIPSSVSGDPLVAILGDLIATEHMAESQEFARIAQKRLAGEDEEPSRGVKQAPFVVLMGVQMPAVLVELGFVTNPRDARHLAREKVRARLARELAAAVRAFGERYDARRGVARSGG